MSFDLDLLLGVLFIDYIVLLEGFFANETFLDETYVSFVLGLYIPGARLTGSESLSRAPIYLTEAL